jgi:hypothetical protein
MRRSPQAGLDAGGAGPADAPRAADAAAADAAVAAESGPGEGVPVPEPQDADVRPDHMEEAVRAAAQASEEGHLGEPGRPLNRRSPFFIGLAAAAGDDRPSRDHHSRPVGADPGRPGPVRGGRP